jgi:UDP-N-acetyl-D-mannosaminuronic acid dehydrogenase
VEPNVKTLPAGLRGLPNVELVSAEAALEAADIVVFLVGHKEFRRMSQSAFQQKMVVDTIGLAG